MSIFRPLVTVALFIGMLAVVGLTAADARALDVVRMDAFLWISAIQGPKESPVTLENPWKERRVQRYLKSARERFGPVKAPATDSFFAWEEADFYGVAGQGRTTSPAKTPKRIRTACCSACCFY